MKNHQTATRIIAGVLPAMALFATPALAQIDTQTTPPPVPTTAAPAPAPEPAAPAAATAPDSAAQQRYQASLDAATGKTASADAPAGTTTRATPSRAAPRATAARPTIARAPVAASAPAAAPAPVATTPVDTVPVEAAPPVSQPVAAPAAETATETTATQTTEAPAPAATTPMWLWLVGGIAALAALVFGVLALRRRNRVDEWEETYVAPEQTYVEPTPLAAAPVAEAELAPAAGDEVAAITEASAPVAGRPWIELALRPLRAGSDEDTASVDLELTLANAGAEAARDVRVSTFMLGDAASAPTDMERLLASGHAGAEVDAGSIGAGQGSRIDAHLAMPRDGMEGATFQPVVGVDVRYTLPDGSEGRTAAAFAVGVADEFEEPTPFRLGGDVREDVAATLHGVPERA